MYTPVGFEKAFFSLRRGVIQQVQTRDNGPQWIGEGAAMRSTPRA
jgi:hypothetical protein